MPRHDIPKIRKSALALMTVAGGLVAATPAMLDAASAQGAKQGDPPGSKNTFIICKPGAKRGFSFCKPGNKSGLIICKSKSGKAGNKSKQQ